MNFQEILSLQPTPENKQYIFDRVATHLMTQSRKSVDPTSDKLCKYRGPDGCMCAIGCLMTDEEYKPAFEGCAATHFRYQEINGTRPNSYLVQFLQELQNIHDTVAVSDWKGCLIMLASDNGIQSNILTNWNFDKEQEKYIHSS
jgi:hypothetical protein